MPFRNRIISGTSCRRNNFGDRNEYVKRERRGTRKGKSVGKI
jgi:hypothetical protein